jgi:hypothetical protein
MVLYQCQEKKVPECRSSLSPSEKELPEWSSGVFHHKNTPGYTYRLTVKVATDLFQFHTWSTELALFQKLTKIIDLRALKHLYRKCDKMVSTAEQRYIQISQCI